MMLRKASIFRIKSELKDEYKKMHNEIWPELKKEIKNAGIKNYSIFFSKDGTIFSYLESELSNDEFEQNMEEYWKKEITKKWSDVMSKYIIKEDKSRVKPEDEDLEEVFHLE